MPQLCSRPSLLRLRSLASAGALLALVAAPLTASTTAPRGEPLPAAAGRGPQVRSLAIPADRPDAGARGLTQVAHLQAPRTPSYSLLGVTWDDPAAGADLVVEVRTHADHGWTDWSRLEADEDHTSQDARRSGARGGTAPLWVGDSRGVQVRVLSPHHDVPTGLRVALVDPGEGPLLRPMATTAFVGMPSVITRRQWGADPRLRDQCWKPITGRSVRAVVVHHTVNANDYAKSQSDNIVRGIYAYHTQSRGWCDIGYNFLVDRYGQIFEGRAGGMRLPVRGAHAGVTKVNALATGVATIGNFDTAWPTTAMKNALVRFIAWRLQTFYRDPHARTTIGGVRYPVIMGHRNVHSTACPGQHLYDWLPTLRDRVADRMQGYHTPIYEKWQREGGAGGHLGMAHRGERWRSGARNTAFNHGRIYWTRSTGAHEIHGPVLGAYARNGGAGGHLGKPTSDVLDARGGAQRSDLEHGKIYYRRDVGAHEIHGLLYRAWARTGWGGGFLGLPTTDVGPAGAPNALRSSFEHGIIYYRGDVGAHEIHPPLVRPYARHGGARGPLGLPRTNVYEVTGGLRINFQHGWIRWDRSSRRATVRIY